MRDAFFECFPTFVIQTLISNKHPSIDLRFFTQLWRFAASLLPVAIRAAIRCSRALEFEVHHHHELGFQLIVAVRN